MGKLWGGRFKGNLAKSAVELSYSLSYDFELVFEDILVNKVQAKALNRVGVLTEEELQTLLLCLFEIETELKSGHLKIEGEDEDIHSFIERQLCERVGDLGKKIHTGKSRNDQVATDMRLYMKRAIQDILEQLDGFQEALWRLAKQHQDTLFPGFTHLQIAQPILLAHHLLAYYEKVKRDESRLNDALNRMDECPLGSAAMAGTNYPIDRHITAQELGFARVTQNSMDAVSDRDFLLEYSADIAILLCHLSQFAEELVLWSSPLLDFIEIGDDYTTGSSIMPQKKNPDMAEIIRGKAAMGISHFTALHTLLKGLTLTYNRDLQDDKKIIFESVTSVGQILACFTGMLGSLHFKKESINAALKKGYILATEIADYLAKKSVPFRTAHHITGEIVQYAIQHKLLLEEIPLSTLKGFSEVFENNIMQVLTIKQAVDSKSVIGGTASSSVKSQLKKIQEERQWQH